MCVGEGGEGDGSFSPPCWISLSNLETVKAVTLVFYRIL